MTTSTEEQIFNSDSKDIKQSILQLISDYLKSEGYDKTVASLEEEYHSKSNHKLKECVLPNIAAIRSAVINGEWRELENLIIKTKVISESEYLELLLYIVYKQEYIEYIHSGNYTKAFQHLRNRLKVFESFPFVSTNNEFMHLCYLLTCSNIHQSKLFRSFDGIQSARKRLFKQMHQIFSFLSLNLQQQSSTPIISKDGTNATTEEKNKDTKSTTAKTTLSQLSVNSSHQSLDFVFTTNEPTSEGGITAAVVDKDSIALSSSTDEKIISKREKMREESRLVQLLQQAYRYQINTSPFHQRNALQKNATDNLSQLNLNTNTSKTKTRVEFQPKITTLFRDYEPFVIPNEEQRSFMGHRGNVKCVQFLGAKPRFIASGSSDNIVRLWDINPHSSRTAQTKLNISSSGDSDSDSELLESDLRMEQKSSEDTRVCTKPYAELTAHTNRIWDIACCADGNVFASASADSSVKLWRLSKVTRHVEASRRRQEEFESQQLNSKRTSGAIKKMDPIRPASTLDINRGDIFGVAVHPSGTHVACGGYDRKLRIFDLEREICNLSLSGHDLSITCVAYNAEGNLIISGSKDQTIRVWDANTGSCIKSLMCHGQIQSLDITNDGMYVLTASKDNSNRLWDVRQKRHPIQRYKGHQNTFKNGVRASFGPLQQLVIGGSEDGNVYIWDTVTGELLSKLFAHNDIVYDVQWNAHQALLASCSEDCVVKTWSSTIS